MSQMGSEETYAVQHKAPRYFDHLGGGCNQVCRHGQAERLGGRQIDDKLEFVRLPDWNVSRLPAAQDFIDQIGGTRRPQTNPCSPSKKFTATWPWGRLPFAR
jgi:hypothetical protein